MTHPIRSLVIVLLVTGLAACATGNKSATASTDGAETITVKGALAYRERIALPPDSSARVTIRDTSIADRKAPVIADRTIGPDNRQIPIAFELDVEREKLQPGRRYTLRGTISGPDGQLLWTTDTAYPIDRNQAVNDVGTLLLVSAQDNGSGGLDLPFKARGNEPGWALTIGDDRMDLEWMYGDHQASTPRPEPETIDNGLRYRATTEDHELTVTVRDDICHSASGMPHPRTVNVRIDGTDLRGCGGAPDSLLTGTEWVVEDIDGGGIIDASRATLEFSPDGRLSGRASCNSYQSEYNIDGEGIELDAIAVTQMACAPALNNQERTFLEVLRNVRRFNIDNTGKLTLRTDSNRTIEAYPAD